MKFIRLVESNREEKTQKASKSNCMNKKTQGTFIPGHKLTKKYGISSTSLRRWESEGKISAIRSPGGFRLYKSEDVEKIFAGDNTGKIQKAKVCYARVSSEKQRGDLDRQIEDLKKSYPNHEIIHEVGSGLNYHRKQFRRLLERVYEGDIEEVCVLHKDRLCRYGIELVEWIFEKADCKLVVFGKDEEIHSAEDELAQDLLSVVNYFVAKNNGLRSAENRRKRKAEKGIQNVSEKVQKGKTTTDSTNHSIDFEDEEDSIISE